MTDKPAERLRVVIFREADQWLAQGLERDIAVQADDLSDLVRRLTLAVEAHAQGLATLDPAPKYFQDLWPTRGGDLHPAAPIALAAPLNLHIVLGLAA